MAMREVEATKIKTYVLKVHVNCQGCRHKVKKLLSRINGVYSVKIDLEEQLVTVSGMVTAQTIIQKLVKSGKHAVLLSSGEADNKRLGRGPIFPTFTQAEDITGMNPLMGEFGHGFINPRVTKNIPSPWDQSGMSNRHELQGIFRGYGIDTVNHQELPSGFPSHGYPQFHMQAGSPYNYYPPTEPTSITESYSPVFAVGSPYTHWS